jgi:hypothetical protein
LYFSTLCPAEPVLLDGLLQAAVLGQDDVVAVHFSFCV